MEDGRLRFLGCFAALMLTVVIVRAQSAAVSDKADAFADAARKGDAAAVKRLLDEGVGVNTKFRYEATALSYACDRGHLDVVKLLLERGAEVNVEDTFYHATPLTWAVNPAMGRKPQHAEIVGLLLKRGAKGKDNALMGAVGAKDVEMTKTVLATGGLSESTLSDALESATRGGSKDVAALLEQAGAKPFVEFKIDEADLAKYAGTYRNMSGVEVVLAIVDGHLTGGPGGQRASLVARDRTTFKLAEVPGITVTFRLESGNVVEMTFNQGGGTQVFSRVQGR
jgi:hypothetical protein